MYKWQNHTVSVPAGEIKSHHWFPWERERLPYAASILNNAMLNLAILCHICSVRSKPIYTDLCMILARFRCSNWGSTCSIPTSMHLVGRSQNWESAYAWLNVLGNLPTIGNVLRMFLQSSPLNRMSSVRMPSIWGGGAKCTLLLAPAWAFVLSVWTSEEVFLFISISLPALQRVEPDSPWDPLQFYNSAILLLQWLMEQCCFIEFSRNYFWVYIVRIAALLHIGCLQQWTIYPTSTNNARGKRKNQYGTCWDSY